MKKLLILTMVLIGVNSIFNPDAKAADALSQGWDLGTLSQNQNPMQSAGVGDAGRQNLTPGYPYVGVPNAMNPNQTPAIYNQNGYVGSRYPVSQQIGFPSQLGRGALAPAQFSTLDKFTGPGGIGLPGKLNGVVNGLPPTTLDSFVRNAGGAASHIYGDEGTNSWPPMNGFSEADSINAGIVGINNKSLTTGHGSKMPAPSQVNINSPGIMMTKSGAR